MKTLGLRRTVLLLIMIIGGMRVNAQQLDSQVPGDNFSLEGALELFKKSSTPEDFEKRLNSSDSKVNNLDLNGDGYIDYIRVIDRNEGNVHAFILQALVSDSESQDIAVISLEKLANGKAVLQITGDADIYGVETIIEPTEEVRVYAGTTTSRRVVNVWSWPSVQYIYSPYYTTIWVSPWRWSYRPYWYRPWRPVAYHVYSPWWNPYHSYYSVCYTHRVVYAYDLYRPYRTTSVIVYNRHHNRIVKYRSSRHDYDHNGRYRKGNSGQRDYRGESVNSRSGRSNGYDRSNSSYTNGRQQTGSRDRSYSRSESNSRSGNSSQNSRQYDYKSSYDRGTTVRQNESSRSQPVYTAPGRSATETRTSRSQSGSNSQNRTATQTRTSRSTPATNWSNTGSSNQRSSGQVSRPAPQQRESMSRSSSSPSRPEVKSNSSQSRSSQSKSGNSRRGGN